VARRHAPTSTRAEGLTGVEAELTIDEVDHDGRLHPVRLTHRAGALHLAAGDTLTPLPHGALGAVIERYGAPLDPGARVHLVAALPLAGGGVLRHVRHLAPGDVIARDWLVLDREGAPSLVALARTVAAALAHLGRAAARP
jgi:hypothetical protein